jgi:hypothetical protein
MIAWDPAIIQSIGRRRSVIMIGAGVSKNSTNGNGKRPSSWEDFLRSACAAIGTPPNIGKLIDQKDFLTACEIIKRKMGRDTFVNLVQREYQQPGYQPATIHEHIYNLDSAIVASPNFDNIYDTYASATSNGSLVIKDHTSTDITSYLGGGDTRLLIKTHGSANNPAHVIFTRKDYAEARIRYVLFYEILKSLILTHTFLFIGCGIDDPDIRALFEDVQFAHDRMPLHFMTIPRDEVDQDVMDVATETMKIRFLPYAPDNGHAELTASLGELVAQVDAFRDQKAADQKW